ncbi:MAG: DUF721 domain-containing protein [Polyangiaceae bacterium]|nr:DUF721 domain-containing protein [Polyangiaceae bacterium]
MSAASKNHSLSYWLKHRRSKFRLRHSIRESEPLSLEGVLAFIDPVSPAHQQSRCPITPPQWQDAVGIRIADRSAPRKLDHDGTLLVAVTNSVWAQELSLLSSAVCEKLRAIGHDVRSVRFLVSAIEPVRRAPARHEPRFVPAPVKLPTSIVESLKTVDDDELRALMESTIAASLAASNRG